MLTPMSQIINSKSRRISRLADINRGGVVLQVINTIGHCTPLGILWKIVTVHFKRFLAPNLAGILKITDQFFLFGIKAQTWLTGLFMPATLLMNIFKLPITVWWLLLPSERKSSSISLQVADDISQLKR